MTHRPWWELFEQLPPEDQAAIKANTAKVIEERRRERGRGAAAARPQENGIGRAAATARPGGALKDSAGTGR